MLDPHGNPERIRYKPDRIRAELLKKYGVHCVDGFSRYSNRYGIYQEQVQPIASFKNIFRAYRIDHSGGQSFAWHTGCLPEEITAGYVAFIFPMACGYGCAYPEPAGTFRLRVNGRHAVDFCESKYSRLWSLGECRLFYDVQRCLTSPEGTGVSPDPYIRDSRMCSFGVGTLVVPSSWCESGQSALIEVSTFEYFRSGTWCRIDVIHEDYADVTVMLDYELGLSEIFRKSPEYPKAYGKNIYFGDVHAHSFCGIKKPCDSLGKYMDCSACTVARGDGNGCGFGTIANNYHNAKHVAGLDFFALTDHDFQMSAEDWRYRCDYANAQNTAGFVTINAYECTSWHYGHRNLYFRDAYPPVWQPLTYAGGETDPEVMFRFFARQGVDFLSVPHHPAVADHPFCWSRFNPEFDRMVEVFSGWGDSEGEDSPLRGNGSYKLRLLYARKQIEQGLRFGFMAGSDSHDGFAGTAQGSAIMNFANKFSEVGSGATAVLADGLSRETIYDALKGRAAYATSGARISVEFSVNGAMIGQTVHAAGNRKIGIRVQAPGEIAKIQILKNGRVLFREDCDQKDVETSFLDPHAERSVDSYYARIFQKDREMAWVTPIWIER